MIPRVGLKGVGGPTTYYATAGPNGAAAASGSSWSFDSGNSSLTSANSSFARDTLIYVEESQHLIAGNFGLSVPTGATILGATVVVRWAAYEVVDYFQGGVGRLTTARLYGQQDPYGSEKTVNQNSYSEPNIATIGGNSDLWGASLTPAIVNASNFSVRLKFSNSYLNGPDVMILVDQVTMSVYYSYEA